MNYFKIVWATLLCVIATHNVSYAQHDAGSIKTIKALLQYLNNPKTSANFGSGQRSGTIQVPGHSLALTYGDTLVTTITNNGTTPARFYPIFQPGADELHFLEATAHKDWLMSGITPVIADSFRTKIDLVWKELRWLKSNLTINSANLPPSEDLCDIPDSVSARKYLTNWQLAHSGALCGEYWTQFVTDLNATGLFSDNDSFRTVNIIEHTIGEIYLYGNWIKIDCDPAEPGSIEDNPANLSGYASVADICSNPQLVQNFYHYRTPAGDSIKLSSHSLAEYRDKYANPDYSPSYSFRNNPLVPQYQMTGDWILPAGASITWEYPVARIIDLTDSATLAITLMVKQLMETNEVDSAFALLGSLLNITASEAADIFITGSEPIDIKDTSTGRLQLYGLGGTRIPALQVAVPPSSDTVYIGSELKIPGVVYRTAQPVMLKDTLANSGFEIPYYQWDANYTNFPYKSINFLDFGGYVPPQGADITVSFNPYLYDFLYGFGIDELNTADTLNIQTTVKSSGTVSSVITPGAPSHQLLAYPNPATAGTTVNIEGTQGNPVTIYDATGKIIAVTKTQFTPTQSGLYFATSAVGSCSILVTD